MGIDPCVYLWGWVDEKNFFSENGYVAYQIKGNEACNNMLSSILHVQNLLTHGIGSNCQILFFAESSHVAYQINENEA